MNRIITLAAALCLALTVSACGQTAPAGASASTSTDASTSAAASAASQESAPETGREKQTTLSMELEGQTEEVPATLYEGEGYSIYIPDEGWTKTTGKLPKGAVDQWVAVANSDVTLTVCAEDETGRSWSASQMRVRVEQDPGTAESSHDWYLYQAFPDEAAEGFGTRLEAICATFSIS
ncbi:hypothetical protein [Oscillibacter sp.]|uniref:hypothetical protein n=1 Tax=Oscillibacter sp. TaxID=1945593 RepID=UPI0033973377